MTTYHCSVCEKEYTASRSRVCCSEACRRVRDEARYVNRRKLSAVDAAYLAGVVDGEGTLSVWKERRPGNAGGFRFKITFTISQANLQYLDDLRRMAGNGSIRSSGPRDRPNHKPCFKLQFLTNETRWVLPQIMPYLRLKQKQAEAVMAYMESIDLGRRSREGMAIRERLYQECHELNRRGLPPA